MKQVVRLISEPIALEEEQDQSSASLLLAPRRTSLLLPCIGGLKLQKETLTPCSRYRKRELFLNFFFRPPDRNEKE